MSHEIQMKGQRRPVVLGPGQGARVAWRSASGGATVKVGAHETDGKLTIYERLGPTGDPGGPPLHRHDFDEAFFVLEGEYLFKVEDRLVTAGVGAFLYVPRGGIHTFRRNGEGVGRMLTICCPGGVEEMFAAAGPEERTAMDNRYGFENLGPPLDAASS